MKQHRQLAVLIGVIAGTAAVQGQQIPDLSVDGHSIQIHAFGSEGFTYTGNNNWLTMKTSNGSFDMTDMAANASMNITDKLRVGAQVYDRNIGQLGQWHPQLDWAQGDYKFKDWFGVRGGLVKTTFGLFNDTQDMDFLHNSALLPQSIYPTDLRDALIRHLGGDVYGNIGLKKLGSLSYTGFAGERNDTKYGGYILLLEHAGIDMTKYGGLQYGGDLRWNTPVAGLLVGMSNMEENITGTGTFTYLGPTPLPYEEHSKKDQADQFYGQYSHGNLHVESEYRRWWRDQSIYSGMFSATTDTRAWYVGGAYRLSKHVELGSYYSQIVPQWELAHGSNGNHLYDKVATIRFDLKNYWDLKIEGHFMDGNGSDQYPVGFYAATNPNGYKPQTFGLVIKTGFNF